MKIAAVCTAYHEADIIGWSVRHLFAEGIDEVLIECPIGDDETIAVAEEAGATVFARHEDYHDQPASINRLAAGANADWIIPFDADEFIYGPSGQSLRQLLGSITFSVSWGLIQMFQQHDWWHVEFTTKPMPKVFYRWSPNIQVGPGNHSLTGATGWGPVLLSLRELQYRSFEHFCRKVEERSCTIDPSFGPEMGWHIRQHAGKSLEELRKVYDEMMAVPTVRSPIPTRLQLPEEQFKFETAIPISYAESRPWLFKEEPHA